MELVFEGQRFSDVRRWGIAGDVLNGPVYGTRYVNEENEVDVVRFTVYDRFFDPAKHYLWPIPQKEIDLLDIEQNSGY